MARIRSVKPEFWDDRKLARSTSRDARMFYMGMWNHADEHGRLNGDELWLKGRIFPYDDDITIDHIKGLVSELADAGRVVPYEHDGDPYLYLPKLSKHQRLEPHKVESRLPEPPTNVGAYRSGRGADLSEFRADSSEYLSDGARITPEDPNADLSARGADSSALLYVAGSKEHVSVQGDVQTDKDASKKPPKPVVDALFVRFWTTYPRKESKGVAETAFAKIVRAGTDAEVIINGAKVYAAVRRGEDAKFTKLPATWLNAKGWLDEPPGATGTTGYKPFTGGGW